jgi:hypothetical protein
MIIRSVAFEGYRHISFHAYFYIITSSLEAWAFVVGTHRILLRDGRGMLHTQARDEKCVKGFGWKT